MKKHYLTRFFALVFFLGAIISLTNAQVEVTAPAGVAGPYASGWPVFGPLAGGFSGEAVFVTDSTGMTTACVGIDNGVTDVTGKVALIDRGGCGFVNKAQAAQAAGAIAAIICNNDMDNPDNTIIMGGDDLCSLTIPTVSLSYNTCQALRVETGLMITYTVDAGGSIDSAIDITDGTHTVPGFTGNEAYFVGATAGQFYRYTAASDGVLNINSCGGGVDTRIITLLGATGACRTEVVANWGTGPNSDDACDDGNGNIVASEVNMIVLAGQEIIIMWDNVNSSDGFDFNVSLGPLPDVNATFTVDMANETVNPAGVAMAWGTSPGDQNVLPLTDNGDGTWSGTITVTTLDTVGYFFSNGLNPITDLEAVPDDCGVDSGVGFNVRTLVVTDIADFEVPSVCFSECGVCPIEGCQQAAIISENLDDYTEGTVGPQSPVWTTWSGTEGGAEDGLVSSEQASSAPHSLKIEGQNGPMDVLLLLGNQDAGRWDLRWKMYVPSGSLGYYNIQDDENPGQQWNIEVQFNDGGTGSTADGGSFTYPQDVWFDVVHVIDVDNASASLIIDGQVAHDWQYGPGWKIGSIDFFPTNVGPHLYYVDDITFRPMASCPANAIICDDFEIYAQSEISAQSSVWAPWTSSPADDGIVTIEQAHNGSCQSLKITDDDPDDQLLLLGDRTSGNYLLEWWMYVEPGQTGYYNLQKFEAPGTEFAIQVEFFADSTATLDAGASDVVTWTYEQGQWMQIQHFIDLDNDWATLMIDGTEIYSWPFSWGTFTMSGTKQLGGVDFFGNTDNLYYIDDVLFQQLPSIPGNFCSSANDINNLLGGGLNTPVSSGLYDNTNYTTSGDPEDGWECFNEPDGGGAAPSLERTIWYTFTGDGNTYFITTPECNATNYIGDGDTQIAVYSGSCGNLTPVACNDDDPNAPDFRAAVELETEDGVTYYMLIDGFGPDFEQMGEFCVEFTQLTQANVEVTFQVDMTNEVNWGGGVSPEGVFISGEFNGWPNPGDALTDMGNNIWAITLAVPPNDTLEYKFQNGTDGWEEELGGSPGGPCTLGNTNNRFVVTGTDAIQLDPVCFNKCVECGALDIDQTVLENGVSVFPNPAEDIVNVRFELPQATDNLHLRLVNTLGQTVYAKELGQVRADNVEISVSELPAGAYMVHLMDGQTTVSRSVVVE